MKRVSGRQVEIVRYQQAEAYERGKLYRRLPKLPGHAGQIEYTCSANTRFLQAQVALRYDV